MKKSLSIFLLASALFSQKSFGATGCYIRAKSIPVDVQIDYGLAEGWTRITNAADDKTKKDNLPFIASKSGKRKVFIKYDKNIYVTDVFTYPEIITISKADKGKIIYTMKTTTWEYKNKEAKIITENEFFEKIKVDKSIIEKYKSSLKDAKTKIKGMSDLQKLKNTLKTQEDIVKSVSETFGYKKERLIYEISVKIELQKRIYELEAQKAKTEKIAAENKVKTEKENLEKMQKESLEKIKIFEKELSAQKEKDEKIKKEKDEEKKREIKKNDELKKAQDDVKKQEDELKKTLDSEKKLEEEMKKMVAEFSKIETNSENLDKKEVSAPEIKDETPPSISEFEQSQQAKNAAKKAAENPQKAKTSTKKDTEKNISPQQQQSDFKKAQVYRLRIAAIPALESLEKLTDSELAKLDQSVLDNIIKKVEGRDEDEDIDFIVEKTKEFISKKASSNISSANLLTLMNEQIEKRKEEAKAKKAAKQKK